MDELKDARVLVTGSDGFIGSHVVEELVRAGARVKAVVFYNSFNSWGWLDHSPVKDQLDVFSGDIRDPHGVETAMRGCEAVLHLAALIAIPYSYHSPDSYVDTNVKGTLNVLQAARRHGVRRVVHTSTSEVYGTARFVPITEEHPLQGQSPYSASKIAADKLAESFHLSFQTPVSVLRPFNTYGPRQSARAVIPTILSQLLSGASELRLGDATPVRDMNFVDDTVAAFLALATSDAALGEVVNAGTGRGVSVGQLAELAMQITGHKVPIRTDEKRQRPTGSEVWKLLASNDKAKKLTAWSPTTTLEAGLEKTARFIKDHLHLYRPEEYAV